MTPRDLFFLIVFLGMAYEHVRRRYGGAPFPRPALPPRACVLGSCAIVVLFFLRLMLIHRAAIDPRTPAWLLHLPVIALYDALSLRYTAYRQTIALLLALVSIASTATLYLIYHCLKSERTRRADWIAVGSAHAALMISALLAPAMASTDAYYYAAYAQLGSQAYASHAVPLPCPSTIAEPGCMEPGVPSVYGPLYLAYTRALLLRVDSAAARIEILRITNALWLEALVLAFILLRFERGTIALLALNPVMFSQYVCDAHNDIIPIALIILGSACAARLPWLTLAFCTAASLVKLPFALLGLPAFSETPARARLFWAGLCLAACAAAAYAWGGRPYADALAYYGRFHSGAVGIAHWIAIYAALAVMSTAVLKRQGTLSGAFTLPALAGGSPFPWYAPWAFPYLQRHREKLNVFLIVLPAASFLMETPFQIPALWRITIAAGAGMTIHALLHALMKRRDSIGGP